MTGLAEEVNVGKSDRPRRTGRAGSRGAGTARETKLPGPAAPIASASLLGIPEEEFTPSVRDAAGKLVHEIELLRREVEQTRLRLEDMARTADQDTLLPILNRRAFVREISRFIAFAERYGTPSSLLYFDLNNFKAVNDAYGHGAGDVVLRHFSDLVASQIRDSDILARLGGDEFGVLLAHVTLDQAQKKALSVTQSLRDKPPLWNGMPVELSFSCGVHELQAGQKAEAAMAEADSAMYAEKRAGAKTLRP
ncbi:MAG TPA: GGDEF domain-containing protein [Micropepsaceae bacterium]|nr:GGDEF domain-containing protein [Micropepsaceae bacterium]